MGKQTRSGAQPQSLGQKMYSQDIGSEDWQGTAQMPTLLLSIPSILYGCACTPGLLSVRPPRHDACLQLVIGLLVSKCEEGT